MASVTAVAVVHEILPNPGEKPDTTAIDKRAVDGPVPAHALGLEGDTQVDTKYHGGRFQALYAYADEDAERWADELGRDVTPGLFGENLRTSGVDVSGAEVGERWQVGEPGVGPLLEVTSPRTPCATFANRMREPHWVKRFTQRKAPGAYLAVVEPGVISAGDAVQVVHRPGHGLPISAVTKIAEPETMARLLEFAEATGYELEPYLRRDAERKARRLATG
ncbi:MOSC domain-containing protein [Spongisporangium articulatum]|uniref:MOSC domain-containing protein n=1 Tax=Spongisporangium articulatum TaxID=3362603 RepID=A0ABW8AL69_9ACTN